jgi:hypothetical protein
MSPTKEQRPSSCREFVEDLTGQSTRKIGPTGNVQADQDVWYLVYKDEEGALHTVKGSTTAIRRSLKEGLLGDASNVRASRAKTGPFEQLRTYPEFRDLVVTPVPLSVPALSGTTSPHLSGNHTRATRPVSPVAPTPPPAISQAAPHIDLETAGSNSLEWVKWAMLIIVAILSALIAFWLLPN